MGRTGFGFAAAICAAFLATAAAAQTYTVYLCDFVLPGDGGEKSGLILAIGTDNKAFTYQNKPGSDQPVRLPVSMRKDGPNHVIYGYAIDVPNADGRTGRFDFRVRVPVAGGPSRVSIQGRGYVKGPTAQGACALNRNAKLPY